MPYNSHHLHLRCASVTSRYVIQRVHSATTGADDNPDALAGVEGVEGVEGKGVAGVAGPAGVELDAGACFGVFSWALNFVSFSFVVAVGFCSSWLVRIGDNYDRSGQLSGAWV
jgi:hypothetical protein